MLAIHLDNILFLLFVAVAFLFQLLTRAATKGGRKTGGDQNRRSTSPPRREQTEEDRIRKFLEALGQPTTSTPPPPVLQRPTYQKPIVLPRPEQRPIARRILSPLPPLTARPPDLPVETQLPYQPPPPQSEPIAETGVNAPLEPTAPPTSKTESRSDIATLLRTASGLRQAILIREIFGPPRSLQPLDLVGTV
ncbi:MAG: hypothetical protein JO201_00990 [Verrucomicrobia bacterium]|nr:hypothetical protein [Verrucomicrobiota bacterium]